MSDKDLFSLRPRVRATEEELIRELKAFKETWGEEPATISDFNRWKNRKHSYDTLRRVFGSWEVACEKVGIPRGRVHYYSDKELLDHFERVWRWRGQPLTISDLVKYNKKNGTTVHATVYVRRWGKFSTFVRLFSQYKLGQITFDDVVDSKVEKNKREPITPRLRAEVLNRDSYTCVDCGASPRKDSSVKLHIHHVNPVSAGGKTVLDNLVTNCETCNLGKSDVVLS